MAKNLNRSANVVDGIYDASAVTPADGTDLTDGPCRAIWVGTAGNVQVVTPGGTTIVLKNMVAGMWHPQGAVRIRAALTTALDILAGY